MALTVRLYQQYFCTNHFLILVTSGISSFFVQTFVQGTAVSAIEVIQLYRDFSGKYGLF